MNNSFQTTTTSTIQVLYEDNHLFVINKRAGDLVQGDKTGDAPLSELIKEFIKVRDHKPGNVFLGVVHRLDRPTSGIVVFAKTSKALSRLNKAFAEKKPKKTYWAVVQDAPATAHGELIHFLARNTSQNKSYAHIKEIPHSKKAILHYELIKSLKNYHLLEINLKTGRHHQIRCQLAAINCIIKGDLKYGAKRSNTDGSIHLHARKLEIEHPVTQETMTIVAPVPAHDAVWMACEA